MKVGAFVGNVCRGVKTLEYDRDYDKHIGYLFTYSNTPNEDISFKIYDPEKDKIYNAVQTIKFTIDGNIGGVINPLTLSPDVLSPKAVFSAFGFKGVDVVSTDITANLITVTVPAETKITSLIPTFSVSDKAQVYVGTKKQLTGTSTFDFSDGVVYKVVSESGIVLKTIHVKTKFEKKIIVTAKTGLSKVYTANDPVFSYTISGTTENLTTILEGSLSREVGENVGEYKITQGTLKAKSGYKIVFNEAVFSIKPKPIKVIAKSHQQKTYTEADPVLEYTVVPKLKDGDKLSGKLVRKQGEEVGNYDIEQGTLSSPNYTINSYQKSVFDITPKPITVTVNRNQYKVYGEDDPIYTYSVKPTLKEGDKFVGALHRTTGKNIGKYAVKIGTLSPGKNYSVTFVSNDFEIKSKPIKVTVNANQKKVYGEEDTVFTYTIKPDLVTGDLFTGALSRTRGEDVGKYAIGKGNLFISSNYTVSFVSGEYEITPKPIVVTAKVNQSKLYADKDPILSYNVVPKLVKGDTFTGLLSREQGENVGTYKILKNNLSAGKNYTMRFEGDVFTIKQRKVVVKVSPNQNKLYGYDDPELIYTYEPKLKDGNSFVGKLERKKGEEVGEYAIEQGSLAISTKNYKIVFKSGIFNIFLGEVIVSADYQEKVYGEEDPEFTYKIVKGLPEKLKNLISGTLSREEGEDVGTYNITQGDLKIKGYRVKFVLSKMEITKATQLITWNQELIFDCDANQKTVLLTATTNSDLPITYDVYDTTVASVSKNILSFHNSGSTKIKAIQKGNKNYLPAPEVELPIIGKITNLISRYSKNTLIFNNASRNYVAWQWYKNGKLIPGATKQYYTDTFLKGSYYVEAKTKEGNKELSCSFKITDSFYFEDKLIKLYPNPVVHKELFSVKLNYDEKALEGAYLIVYDIRGKAITRIPKVKKITQITAPDATGIYVVRLTLYNGTYESINLLVK